MCSVRFGEADDNTQQTQHQIKESHRSKTQQCVYVGLFSLPSQVLWWTEKAAVDQLWVHLTGV